MIDMALESAEEGGEVNMRDVLDEMLEALCEDIVPENESGNT